MADDKVNHLFDAIARNSAAVLSLPSAGMLRHSKTRFLAIANASFWIESAVAERPLIDALILEKTPAGISFKAPNNIKVVFSVPILERDPAYRVNAEVQLEALRVAIPQEVKAVQRRSQYRVRPTAENGLELRMWRIAEHVQLRDRPMASLEMPVKIQDLSTGGLGIVCPPKDDVPQRVVANERLRIMLKFRGEEDLLLEGRILHPVELPNKSIKAGVAFKKLGEDLAGRQNAAKLTTIVGQLQRDEVRRMRMG